MRKNEQRERNVIENIRNISNLGVESIDIETSPSLFFNYFLFNTNLAPSKLKGSSHLKQVGDKIGHVFDSEKGFIGLDHVSMIFISTVIDGREKEIF